MDNKEYGLITRGVYRYDTPRRVYSGGVPPEGPDGTDLIVTVSSERSGISRNKKMYVFVCEQ